VAHSNFHSVSTWINTLPPGGYITVGQVPVHEFSKDQVMRLLANALKRMGEIREASGYTDVSPE